MRYPGNADFQEVVKIIPSTIIYIFIIEFRTVVYALPDRHHTLRLLVPASFDEAEILFF